jgi:hypothetical protein
MLVEQDLPTVGLHTSVEDGDSNLGKGAFEAIPFFAMSGKDKQRFANGVHEARGVLPVLVHPYFHTPDRGSHLQLSSYETARDLLIDSSLANGLPLTVFEVKEKVDLLAERIGRNGTIYVVETTQRSPYPVRGNWTNLAECMKECGVTAAGIHGAYIAYNRERNGIPIEGNGSGFYNQEGALNRLHESADAMRNSGIPARDIQAYDWVEQQQMPSGCVGRTAYELLAQGINVRISDVTLPFPDSSPK